MTAISSKVIKSLALPVLLVVVWGVFTTGNRYLYFPSLSSLGASFQSWWSSGMTTDLVSSLVSLLVGYGIAVAAGILIGCVLGLSKVARTAFGPYLHFIRSIPPITFIPICILLFGIGASMRISVIAIGSAFPIVLATMDGVRGIDPGMLDMAHTFGLSRWERLRHVILPGASPTMLAGMKTALSIAIILIVTSEMQASTAGVGYFVIHASQIFAIADSWAGTIVLGVIGYVLSLAFSIYQRRALFWVQGGSSHAS